MTEINLNRRAPINRTMVKPSILTIAATALVGLLCVNQTAYAQSAKPTIIHDAEYYILDAQNGEQWKVEDNQLDAKLAELKKKFGTPPNIIHFM